MKKIEKRIERIKMEEKVKQRAEEKKKETNFSNHLPEF